jgi:hypothetical protein
MVLERIQGPSMRLLPEDNPWHCDAPSRAECPLRRIWEVDAEARALAMGVLLRRHDVEELLGKAGERDLDGVREDALRLKVLLGCKKPCRFAEAVEEALDRKTRALRVAVEGCAMIQLAEWWSRERDGAAGEELAALLWRLACDPRPYLEELTTRVCGDLWIRSMGLLRAHRPVRQQVLVPHPADRVQAAKSHRLRRPARKATPYGREVTDQGARRDAGARDGVDGERGQHVP